MNALPDYRIIDFFDWIQSDECTLGFVRECVFRARHNEKALEDLRPYAEKYIRQKRLDIISDELTASIKHYLIYRCGSQREIKRVERALWEERRKREVVRDSNGQIITMSLMLPCPAELSIELDFLEWLLNRRLDADDISKMPLAVFEKMASDYLNDKSGTVDKKQLSVLVDAYKIKNPQTIIDRIKELKSYYDISENKVEKYKSLGELFSRYSNPDIVKSLFLPLSSDNEFEGFIRKSWEDLNSLSKNYLDIYYSVNELSTSGYSIKDKFHSLNIPESALPCFVLWVSSIEKSKYIELRDLDYKEIFQIIQTIVEDIKQNKDFETVYRGAIKIAGEMRANHTPATYHNLNIINNGVAGHITGIATNTDISGGVTGSVNQGTFSRDIKKAVEQINSLSDLQEGQKRYLADILNDAKSSEEKQDETGKIICKEKFQAFIAGTGKVADKVISILANFATIAAFFGLSR
ncbi:MAG: hypothetical protein FWH06_00655 [Oscillospiraceae bacterium]|nr:hypothetical protein [Oscillospiraceae bacterium]